MANEAQSRLADAAEKLQPHRGAAATADQAHDDVQAAADSGETDGLLDRLDHYAIELEANHPVLAGLVRGIIEDLSAIGI